MAMGLVRHPLRTPQRATSMVEFVTAQPIRSRSRALEYVVAGDAEMVGIAHVTHRADFLRHVHGDAIRLRTHN